MRIVEGQFSSKEQADAAALALKQAGVGETEISVAESDYDSAVLVTATVDDTIADAAEAILGSEGVAESPRRTIEAGRALEKNAAESYEESRVGDPISSPFPR